MVSAVQHPNAERLRVCMVDTGEGSPIQVVCGAPNARTGMKSVFAPPGTYIPGKNITLGVGTIQAFTEAFFGPGFGSRLRPSYFPFTEPSAEFDIRRPDGSWLELGGCGMVHPNVLRNCGLDPDEFQGFAWGMGIDRIAMLKYGMPDLRPFFEADVRWLNHYGFRPLDIPSLVGGLTS